MKNSTSIKVFYRLSNFEASISKKKLQNATKQHCLENCIREFGADSITVFGDTLNPETENFVKSKGLTYVPVKYASGAGTFMHAFNAALELEDDTIVYLLEDDFLHLPGSKEILLEAASKYNAYVTLYDHPDKYIDRDFGGNPQVTDGGEVTKLIRTESSHWKITNSTVMSFAARVSRLKADRELMKSASERFAKMTDSYWFFTQLSQTVGVPVLSAVPGLSTHCETKWLSPFTNWTEV
jgi:hypothetical protein